LQLTADNSGHCQVHNGMILHNNEHAAHKVEIPLPASRTPRPPVFNSSFNATSTPRHLASHTLPKHPRPSSLTCSAMHPPGSSQGQPAQGCP
jgi:hypothetical protein